MLLTPTRRFFRVSLLAWPVLISTAALSLSALPALAQASHHRTQIVEVLDGLKRGLSIGQVAISPDGKRLAWVEETKDGAEIRVSPFDNLAKSERITAAAKPAQHCREGQLAWSPDSSTLAFFSNCAKPGQADLYLSHLDSNPARRLTELSGYEDAPAFSPDGTRVAFLYVEGATRPAGALAAMKPPSGVVGEEGVEIERVAVVPVAAEKLPPSGFVAPALVTPVNLHVYEFDWRPDGQGLAYIAADPPGENNWWLARLYTQALGNEPRAILAPATVAGPLHGLQIAVPRWSPDGKQIAFIGGLMSDQGSTGGDVWIVPAAGGEPLNLTPQRPSSPAWIEWDGNRQPLRQRNGEFRHPTQSLLTAKRPGRIESFLQFLQHLVPHSRRHRRWPYRTQPFVHRQPLSLRFSRQHIRRSDGNFHRLGQNAAFRPFSRLCPLHPTLSLQRRRETGLGQIQSR